MTSPRPWRIDKVIKNRIRDAGSFLVADCEPRDGTFTEGYANAQLIVSAVTLD